MSVIPILKAAMDSAPDRSGIEPKHGRKAKLARVGMSEKSRAKRKASRMARRKNRRQKKSLGRRRKG